MIKHGELKLQIEQRVESLRSTMQEHYTAEVENAMASEIAHNPTIDFPIKLKVSIHSKDDGTSMAMNIIRKYLNDHGYLSVHVNRTTNGSYLIVIDKNGTMKTRGNSLSC
ncbi:hypothetical protein NVP1081O_303 [Vibrio phage 1.081.O._10N.286.52.C2]|nr:hypothetical protein NVP1081O_303 [Vibrio phage 1.081.O._10N.286.52.C2]